MKSVQLLLSFKVALCGGLIKGFKVWITHSKVDSLKGSQEIWITPSILAGIEAIGIIINWF